MICAHDSSSISDLQHFHIQQYFPFPNKSTHVAQTQFSSSITNIQLLPRVKGFFYGNESERVSHAFADVSFVCGPGLHLGTSLVEVTTCELSTRVSSHHCSFSSHPCSIWPIMGVLRLCVEWIPNTRADIKLWLIRARPFENWKCSAKEHRLWFTWTWGLVPVLSYPWAVGDRSLGFLVFLLDLIYSYFLGLLWQIKWTGDVAQR
jgi:hypothetical protein